MIAVAVADVPDHLTGDRVDIDVGRGRDFAEDEDQAGLDRGLAGDAAHRVHARTASSTASEIWSQTLSGCPSVTDSEVKSSFGEESNVVVIDDVLGALTGPDSAGNHGCGP